MVKELGTCETGGAVVRIGGDCGGGGGQTDSFEVHEDVEKGVDGNGTKALVGLHMC